MKKLAVSLGVAALVLAALLIAAEQLPITFVVVRSTRLAAAPDVAFARLSDLRSYPAWSKLMGQHPGTDHFEGSGPGSTWTFTRKNGEPGKIQLDVAEPPARVELHMVDAPPSNPRVSWTIEPDGAGSKLTQRFEGQLRLLGKLARIIRPPEQLIGSLLEEDLASFKVALEAEAPR